MVAYTARRVHAPCHASRVRSRRVMQDDGFRRDAPALRYVRRV
jgi:hypothetical protein